MELGDRLKKLREEKGLSQIELARALNISNVMLSRYEKNKRSPDYETLNKLADYYGVSTDYLLGRIDIRNHEALLASDPKMQYESLPPEIFEHLKIVARYFIEEERIKKDKPDKGE